MSERRSDAELVERLAAAGRRLGAREAEHAEALARARGFAQGLRERVAAALRAFGAATAAQGAGHLAIEVGPLQTDEKHLRAVEFDLRRGRHRAIVTVKSRGDVTLVGPFRMGKTEGPCKSFPQQQSPELEAALADFLEHFVEEAAAP